MSHSWHISFRNLPIAPDLPNNSESLVDIVDDDAILSFSCEHQAMAAAAPPMAAEPIRVAGAQPQGRAESGLPPASYFQAANELFDAPTNGVAPKQYTGQGEADAPRSPVRKPHKKTSSLRMNGHTMEPEGSNSQLIVEKFQDRDGEHLTTIKQYRPHSRGETQIRRSDELVSGRRVGTKWERSQYVWSYPIACYFG